MLRLLPCLLSYVAYFESRPMLDLPLNRRDIMWYSKENRKESEGGRCRQEEE